MHLHGRMRLLLLACLTGAVLACSVGCGSSPDPAADDGDLQSALTGTTFQVGAHLRVTASALNIRRTAAGTVMSVLPNGQALTVAAASGANGWVNVTVDGASTKGWVAVRYVQKVSGGGTTGGGTTGGGTTTGGNTGEGGTIPAGAATTTACNTTVYSGIDVSVFQGTIDWDQVAASGVTFAIARAAYGDATPDTQFVRNWQEMKRVGIIRGAYHYVLASQNADTQASVFFQQIQAAGGLAAGDIPPILDLEAPNAPSNPAPLEAAAHTWLNDVQAQYGVQPIVYTASYMSGVTRDGTFSQYPLWVANYRAKSSCPTMPTGFSDWTMWQYSETGNTPGITDNEVDFNVARSSLQQFLIASVSSGSGAVPGAMPTAASAVPLVPVAEQLVDGHPVGVMGSWRYTVDPSEASE
jgi:lysozyme